MKQGINFRSGIVYVTDGTDEHGEISTVVNYPTASAQGNNVGWETLGGAHVGNDSDSGLDPRLAGSHSCAAWTNSDYRIDLPAAGDYVIRVAAGDAVKVNSNKIHVQLFDDATLLGTLVAQTYPTDGRFTDATNVEHTAANWPGSNSSVIHTFASTILRFRIPASGDKNVIAHVYVESVGGITGTLVQVTETSSAQPISKLNVGVIGQATESSISQAISAAKTGQIAQATEFDVAQSVTGLALLAMGQTSETDSALLFNPVSISKISQVTEVNSSQPVIIVGVSIINQAAETDSAQSLSGSKAGSINQVIETDTAQLFNPASVSDINQVTESDSTQTIKTPGISILNSVTETDIAQSMSGTKAGTFNQVVEADGAQSINVVSVVNIGQVSETDAALSITGIKLSTVGQVNEVDTAISIAVVGGVVNIAIATTIEMSSYNGPIVMRL